MENHHLGGVPGLRPLNKIGEADSLPSYVEMMIQEPAGGNSTVSQEELTTASDHHVFCSPDGDVQAFDDSHRDEGKIQSPDLPYSNSEHEHDRTEVKPKRVAVIVILFVILILISAAVLFLLREALFPAQISDETQMFGFCNYGLDGTGASSVCEGGAEGGTWCNTNQEQCEECNGRWCFSSTKAPTFPPALSPTFTPSTKCNHVRCGVDWEDANSRCGTNCASYPNSGWDACLGGEECFSDCRTDLPCCSDDEPF